MRQAARQASILAMHGQNVERLQSSVESGNTTLLERIADFAAQSESNSNTASTSSARHHLDHYKTRLGATAMNLVKKKSCNSRSHRFHLPLPMWLVGNVWELSVRQCNGAWTIQLSPVNIRPGHTYVFDFVRAGDVEAVRELLRSGKLSLHDRDETGINGNTLLEVSDTRQCNCPKAANPCRCLRITEILSFAGSCCKKVPSFVSNLSYVRRFTSLSTQNHITGWYANKIRIHSWKRFAIST
jgi:hypothetical protein